MKITVVGCGRWGSCIAWYLDRNGHDVTVFGEEDAPTYVGFKENRTNGVVTFPESIHLTADLDDALNGAETVVISIPSQNLRAFMQTAKAHDIGNKTFVLCMKGIEVETGKLLHEVVEEYLPKTSSLAVWVGPGHVQEFVAGHPNCMVIDSFDKDVTAKLISEFSSDLIRFYHGTDMIGTEIGSAVKNVIGIAAGILDGLNRSSLKGALMSRSTFEVARLMKAMGANPFSSFGLCHLGDFEATVFSEYSHNRQYGESLVTGCETFGLAEGYYTVAAVKKLAEKYNVDMPICEAVYDVIYNGADVKDSISKLFSRSQKEEFII